MSSYERTELGLRPAQAGFDKLRQQGVALEAASEAAVAYHYLVGDKSAEEIIVFDVAPEVAREELAVAA
jgi:hypothetical protein